MRKTWSRTILAFVIAGVLLSAPIWLFVGQSMLFAYELSALETKIRQMPSSEALIIISEAKQFARLHAKEAEFFDYRLNESVGVGEAEVPASISWLKPRRISGTADSVNISLMFMMDTGGGLRAYQAKDGEWRLEGQFGELEPAFQIFPK